MDQAQVKRIRDSFDALAPKVDELMTSFYDRLFTENPTVRPMFPQDMAEQKKHLAAAVGLVVKNADKLDAITPALEEMGARHVGYGAQPAHYGVVRDTLLAAMADLAGSIWTAQLEEDWKIALNAVAEVMLRGAENAQRKAA